jgi:hypothetical protein
MKISTAKLKELVEKALEDDKRQWEQEELDFEARKAKSREDWIQTWGEKWVIAADEIYRKVAAGEPIVESDLPKDRDGYSRIATYAEPRTNSRHERDYVLGKAEYKQPQDLVRFLAFLEVVEDDTISTSALRDHGLVNLQNRILAYIHEATER